MKIIPSGTDKRIGEIVKKFRQEANISQSELSRLLGFNSPTAMFYLENGLRAWKVSVLEKVAHILHIPMDTFWIGKDVESKDGKWFTSSNLKD